jgi:hypothetical protein
MVVRLLRVAVFWILLLVLVSCRGATGPASLSPVTTPSAGSSPTGPPTRAPALTFTPTPTSTPTPLAPGTSAQGTAALTFLKAMPVAQTFPAGSTVMVGLSTDPNSKGIAYDYWVEGLPGGITANFQASAAPYERRLFLDTSGTLAPGPYIFYAAASAGQSRPVYAQITLNVTSCTEFPSGVFTESVQSNLIGLSTAGKPSWEEGLLVRLQVCASDEVRRLRVTLEAAVSEAGTPMTTPPRFYLFRSLEWSAPGYIDTHNRANAARLEDAIGWELEYEMDPGLWLLVFERARYLSSDDPEDIPSVVTFRLTILH